MDLTTREVAVAGVSAGPSRAWMVQVARNLTDPIMGFLPGKRYLLCDRHPLYTREFCETLQAAGVTPGRLPPRSPDLNANAERIVRSIKAGCLDRMTIIGERHLRLAIAEYVDHYHRERNHQELENYLIATASGVGGREGSIHRRDRLGGLLRYYCRRAA